MNLTAEIKKDVEWKVQRDMTTKVPTRFALHYKGGWRCSFPVDEAITPEGIARLLIKFSDRSYSYVSKQSIAELIHLGLKLRAELRVGRESQHN